MDEDYYREMADAEHAEIDAYERMWDLKVGVMVRLRADAHVLPVVREVVGSAPGEIVDYDNGFDWVVFFPKSTRRGGMFGFNTEDLERA